MHYMDNLVHEMNDSQKQQYFDVVDLADKLLHTDWETMNAQQLITTNTDVIDFLKREGYWYSDITMYQHYPIPQTNTFKQEDMDVFLPKLKWVENEINAKKTNNRTSKKSKNVLNGAFKMNFMGFSKCRCCGINNCTGEYYYQGWAWPEGFMHYLEEHKVEPTAAFMVFINTTYAKFN